ncbi:hypothetical protein BH23BAC4_BH23BAC4_13050 [soil metagenome]
MKPRIHDDGSILELDLHGVRVAEAERFIANAVAVAASRGRDSVRVIHGYSTYADTSSSIKAVLERLLETDRLKPHVTAVARLNEGVTLLGLMARARDARAITLLDVW